MNRKNLLKIGIVILLIAVIFMQAYRIQASSFSQFAGNEIGDENGSTGGGLNQLNNNTANNAANEATNKTANNVANNATNNATNSAANKNANQNKLPQTGTNENIIISLMVIFAGVGVYTFKKVRDYNI